MHDRASKTGAKSKDTWDVAEKAQVSSAVIGRNGQRLDRPGDLKSGWNCERKGAGNPRWMASGGSPADEKRCRRETTRSFERSESVGKRPAVTSKGDPAWP
jgi:hypothetical protein